MNEDKTTKPTRNAGKGMTPKKGYNYKNWSQNWDLIDWKKEKKPLTITVKIDENTIGEL